MRTHIKCLIYIPFVFSTSMTLYFILCYQVNQQIDSNNPLLHINSTKSVQRKFLWCVNHYGPNNQIKDFIKCTIIAAMNNYSVVLPPLFPHYQNRIRGIQWFQHFYDWTRLKNAIDLITFDDFIRLNSQNESLISIDCYIEHVSAVENRRWYADNALKSIQYYFRKTVDFKNHANLSYNFDLNELALKASECSSIFLHIHYTKFDSFFTTSNIYMQRIFRNLHRTPLIARMAERTIGSFHDLQNKTNASRKDKKILAVVHFRLGDVTVLTLDKYLEQIKYLLERKTTWNHLHIMCPYLNASNIKYLKDRLPARVTTTPQLYQHFRFVLNDFLFDILEQEIAFQAEVFIGSPWTTFSATVIMQRIYQRKGPVYLFSSNEKEHPFLVTEKNAKYFQ